MWSGAALLNVDKTKEMVVDLSWRTAATKHSIMMSKEKALMENNKHLDVHLNNRLHWRTNIDTV